jgi:hypothetical protein
VSELLDTEQNLAAAEDAPGGFWRRRAVHVTGVAVGAVLATGLVIVGAPDNFALRGLTLTKDERVHITSPHSGALVEMPLTIRWRHDAGVLPRGGAFAVFVDRPPVRPGRGLRALIDDRCTDRISTPCPPDVRAGKRGAMTAYLADLGIHLTTRSPLVLGQLPEAAGKRNVHEVSIVVVDSAWRRLGESVYFVEFAVQGTDTASMRLVVQGSGVA